MLASLQSTKNSFNSHSAPAELVAASFVGAVEVVSVWLQRSEEQEGGWCDGLDPLRCHMMC